MTRMLLIFTLLLSPVISADIRLPKLIGEGMVLQRDTKIPLWGWAEPGEQVQVRLNGELVGQTRSSSEQWQITLPPRAAGGPHRTGRCLFWRCLGGLGPVEYGTAHGQGG